MTERIAQALIDEQATLHPDLSHPEATLSAQAASLLSASRSASSSPAPVSVQGEIVVLGLLGEGGMGRVELAHQTDLDREVAVKRLKAETASPASEQALMAEARLTGQLEHPNIVPVHLLDRDPEGHPRLVMKRLEGVSWRDLLRDPHHPQWGDDRLDRLTRHLEILSQVCNALHFAHSRGVVHRDVKPANVMVGAFGEVCLVDWGIALRPAELGAAGSRHLSGTPAYLAPEQLTGDYGVSPLTDVYQLGAVLHEVLTGRPRHEGASVKALLESAADSSAVTFPPSVPAELADLSNRATSRDPAVRPASALAFRRALEDYLRHRGSDELAQEAAQGLLRLRPQLATLDEPQVRRVLTETRFGFVQALRAWEGNARARAGLQSCLELAALYELDHRNEAAAAALLAELAVVPPALAERLEQLRQRKATEEAAVDELSSQRYHRGLGTRWRQRAHLAAGINLVFGSLMLGLTLWGPPPRAVDLFGASLVILGMATLPNTVLAPVFIRTDANRKFLRSLWLTFVVIAAEQGYGVLRGIAPADLIRLGLLTTLTTTLVLGVALIRRVAWVAASVSIALVVGLLGPERPLVPLIVYFFVNVALFATVLGAETDREEQPS